MKVWVVQEYSSLEPTIFKSKASMMRYLKRQEVINGWKLRGFVDGLLYDNNDKDSDAEPVLKFEEHEMI